MKKMEKWKSEKMKKKLKNPKILKSPINIFHREKPMDEKK